MSDFASKLQIGSVFNRSAYAGPRRFLVIGGCIVGVAGAIAYVSMSGSTEPLVSQTGRLPKVNPLPGGLNGNSQQNKLALQTNQEQAEQAAQGGLSYTPPIAASHTTTPAPAVTPQPVPITAPTVALHPVSPAPPAVVPQPVQYRPDPMARPVAQTAQVSQAAQNDPQEQQAYADALNRLLRGWNGRSPRTEVIVEPSTASADEGSGNEAGRGRSGDDNRATRNASFASRLDGNGGGTTAGRLLMPAGRGIFAHTVLAVSSDSEGPVVLQADSGPLNGDRMIGTFGKASSNGSSDRLVIRVNSIEHRGQTIGVNAIVTAPDTMETTVASSVDEHYLARFALPAAAAFVAGLGQALATTSNTVGVLSPLGGTSYSTQLNFPQQIGVGAGVAAQQLSNTLNQQAPRSATIHVDANVNVGVMFLAAVTENSR